MARQASLACRLLALGTLLGVAHAQIRVMTPKWLVKTMGDQGRITGSTTTIGAPFYGDRVLGRLVWGPSVKNQSYCTMDDYEVPPAYTAKREGSDYDEVRLINIVLVERGVCSFATKVQVAHKKGAHAVIIFDKKGSKFKREDMQHVIVQEDGFATDIHIPSVFVARGDGMELLQAAQQTQVIIELAWDVPTHDVVNVDLWMSSGSSDSLQFLKEFAHKRRVLNEVVSFQPHYAIFAMDHMATKKEDKDIARSFLCSDKTWRFCAEDPDGEGPINGGMVVQEDLRQLCIHDIYKVPKGSPTSLVEYSAQYWDYMERLPDRCPMVAQSKEDIKAGKCFGAKCSQLLMVELGIDFDKVQHCVVHKSDEKLEHEREHTAWSPRALQINGWRYSGILDAELVTRAICAGFISQPAECAEILRPRNPFEAYVPHRQEGGVSFFQLFFWIGGFMALMWCSLLLYRRYLSDKMRSTLREEVMLEVQAQMGEYSQMK